MSAPTAPRLQLERGARLGTPRSARPCQLPAQALRAPRHPALGPGPAPASVVPRACMAGIAALTERLRPCPPASLPARPGPQAHPCRSPSPRCPTTQPSLARWVSQRRGRSGGRGGCAQSSAPLGSDPLLPLYHCRGSTCGPSLPCSASHSYPPTPTRAGAAGTVPPARLHLPRQPAQQHLRPQRHARGERRCRCCRPCCCGGGGDGCCCCCCCSRPSLGLQQLRACAACGGQRCQRSNLHATPCRVQLQEVRDACEAHPDCSAIGWNPVGREGMAGSFGSLKGTPGDRLSPLDLRRAAWNPRWVGEGGLGHPHGCARWRPGRLPSPLRQPDAACCRPARKACLTCPARDPPT